jgi:hypothetical protein
MANVTLSFTHTINVSVQIGDVAYYTPTLPVPLQLPGQDGNWASTTTPHMAGNREDIKMIGPITSITLTPTGNGQIVCDMPNNLAAQYGPPNIGDFIMFSKDNKANLSSLLGYYCLVQLRNNSTEKSELFTIAADFTESSK